MLLRNPEFIRNVWTELTPKRLIAMPLLLITAYLVTYMASNMVMEKSVQPTLCLFFYCIFTYVWGTRLAAETVIKEINHNTWYFQAMTPMAPVTVAIGKLFGSTAYVWYGNFICFILYFLSYHIGDTGLTPLSTGELFSNIVLFIILGVLAHIVPLLFALDVIRWRHFFEKFDVTFFQFIGMAVIVPLWFALSGDKQAEAFLWYGHWFSLREMIQIVALILIAWSFIAIVNQIKYEFGQEPYPVSWFLFALSVVIVLFGFNNYESNVPFISYIGTSAAFFVVLGLTYLSLCGESNMALRPHMMLKYYRTKQYKRLFMIMPRSLITVPLILVLAVVLIVEFASFGDGQGESIGFMVFAMIFFMLRDFCFVYLYSLFAQGNEKVTTVVPDFIILATYTIVPIVLFKMDLPILRAFFMPTFYENNFLTYNESITLTIIPPMLEFAVLFVLLIFGIRKKIAQIQEDIPV
ncbi:MAG: hypothetical protein IKD08_06050 [Alphaproteobacteria bacterium]|nr:hypothetical protein [Alphaproteobacteria bacterium]